MLSLLLIVLPMPAVRVALVLLLLLLLLHALALLQNLGLLALLLLRGDRRASLFGAGSGVDVRRRWRFGAGPVALIRCLAEAARRVVEEAASFPRVVDL